MLVAYSLILPEQEAYLSAAYAYVACRDVGIGTDMSVELGHEALAECHDFPVALALGVKVGTALAAADGKPRKAVFENLLKA